MQILIVEDNHDLREMLAAEFEAASAPTARFAIPLLLGHRFDLLITDIELPVDFLYDPDARCGIGLIHIATAASMPVIAMSGDERHRAAALAAGAKAFVSPLKTAKAIQEAITGIFPSETEKQP